MTLAASGVMRSAVSAAQVGLQVLVNDRHVFECHRQISDAVYNAEVGSSLAILQAGYSIDSLMLRYQGVDWTNPENWQCNDKCAAVIMPVSTLSTPALMTQSRHLCLS